MSGRRGADELLDVPDPAWPVIAALVCDSSTPAEIVEADDRRRRLAIESLQVSASSYLGAMAGGCGAIRVDHGWLRLLAAGADGLPSIQEITDLVAAPAARYLVIAVDVLGGRFAINGGDLAADIGEVCYWGADTLDWLPTTMTHSEFVRWAMSDQLDDFYATLRWPGWESEVSALALDRGLSVQPFPFTREGRDLAAASRRAVHITELLQLYSEVARQLAGQPESTTFRVVRPE